MGFFKKNKVDEIFGEDVKAKRHKRRMNFAVFCIIFIILLINSIYFIINHDFSGYKDALDSIKIYEMSEDSLNLTWSKNKADENIIKSKFSYAELNEPANELTKETINSSSNTPTRSIRLNFDEIAYVANIILSSQSNFTLIDFVWETKENVATITTHYSYRTTIASENQKITLLYFEEVFEYNFSDYTTKGISGKIINVGKGGKVIEDLSQIKNIRIYLTTFILQNHIIPLNDITESNAGTSEESKPIEFDEQSKTLSQMLGYTDIDFLSGGIQYLL